MGTLRYESTPVDIKVGVVTLGEIVQGDLLILTPYDKKKNSLCESGPVNIPIQLGPPDLRG